MTQRIPRLGASLIALGLTFATITGGMALSASAAGPAVPAQQVVASFQGVPDAATLNEPAVDGGATYSINDIPEGAQVGIGIAVERASNVGTFEVLTTPFVQPITGGTFNALFNSDVTGVSDLVTGDRLRFTYTVNSVETINYYTIPAVGSASSLAPVVTISGDYTGADAIGAGIPVTISNLDTQKTLAIIVSVQREAQASSTVISRTYVAPSAFASGTYSATVHAFNELDTDIPLGTNDFVTVEARSGACCGNFQGFASEQIVAATTPPTPGTPAGEFDPAAPTAAEFLAGVTYNFTGLDSAEPNTANLYAASASSPTAFTLIGTVPIDAGDIIAGATSITVAAYYVGTPNTQLNAGDVVQVRLAVGSDPEVTTTTYVIPGAVVTPGAPNGSFGSASPSANDFLDGVEYTISDLDSSVSNTVSVYVKSASSSVYELLESVTIDPSDIVGGDYLFTITAFYSPDGGLTRTALAAGDTVRVGLVTDGGAEVVLTDYVIAAAPITGGDGDNGGNLAATGADDQRIQRDLIMIMGGALALSFLFAGIRMVLRRREDAMESMTA